MLKIENLSHGYGERKVLDGINLEVGRGEVFALIGPTGAGKTTLLRIIDILEKPTSGRVYLDGKDITASRSLADRRRLAFVLQKPVVFNTSVYNNIAVGLRWRGHSAVEVKEKVDFLLEEVGLTSLRDKNARTLSGGEAQRVAIARAMAVEPDVLLLDEPTANLDPVSTARIETFIRSIHKRYQTTIIMTTHDHSQGRRLASKLAVMNEGKIIQAGEAEAVFRTPANRLVAEFIGTENILPGVVVEREGETAVIEIGNQRIEAVTESAVGEEVYAFIRADEITISLSKGVSSARNNLSGVVTMVSEKTFPMRVEVDCGFSLVALVTRLSVEEMDIKTGRQVYAGFKATGIHVISR